MITVQPADPRDPGCAAILQASHALMQALYPAESNHYLTVEALTAPDIRFFAAAEAGKTLGCGALAVRDGYGEVKSMFTAETARGRGVGDRILTTLISVARLEGLPLLRLETGHSLDAALRLYERHGFRACAPFGDYRDDPLSQFMELQL